MKMGAVAVLAIVIIYFLMPAPHMLGFAVDLEDYNGNIKSYSQNSYLGGLIPQTIYVGSMAVKTFHFKLYMTVKYNMPEGVKSWDYGGSIRIIISKDNSHWNTFRTLSFSKSGMASVLPTSLPSTPDNGNPMLIGLWHISAQEIENYIRGTWSSGDGVYYLKVQATNFKVVLTSATGDTKSKIPSSLPELTMKITVQGGSVTSVTLNWGYYTT